MTIEEIKKNPNLDLSERIKIYSKRGKFSKEDIEEFAILSIKQDYEYWVKNRINISPNTDKILELIKNGHVLNDWEALEMICDNPAKIGEHRKYKILEKIIFDNKKITQKDFDNLCKKFEFDKETKELIEKEFNSRKIIIDDYDEIETL